MHLSEKRNNKDVERVKIREELRKRKNKEIEKFSL